MARVEQLEALLEDAEIENQNLTEQLEEYLTGGGPGTARSVGSAAEETQSTYSGAGGGGAAGATGGTGPGASSYGDYASLTHSALEQRLALAEARRDEVASALEDASRANRRLTTEARHLQEQLSAAQQAREALEADTAAALQRMADVCDVDPGSVLGPELAARVLLLAPQGQGSSLAPARSTSMSSRTALLSKVRASMSFSMGSGCGGFFASE